MPEDDPRHAVVVSAEAPAIFTDEGAVIPATAVPGMLVQGFRFLQRHVPGFRPLSIEERQSMTNVAHLDPELIAAGLHAAGAWEGTKMFTGMTAEEIRAEHEAITDWADTKRELLAFIDGIDGALLTRKHRVGTAILQLYAVLGNLVDDPKYAHLRPYYEEMRRATRRRRMKRKAAKTPDGAKTPGE